MNRFLSYFVRGKTYAGVLLVTVSVILLLGFVTPPRSKGNLGLRSGSVDFNGMSIHYKNRGKGDQAVVFIHGWSCNMTFWRFQTPAFGEDRCLILIDLPGHGQSSKPNIAYTQDLFADAVAAVLEDAGVGTAILVGHSMGAPVARRFIRKYPDKAKALVSVDGAFNRIPKEKKEFEEWKKRFNGLVKGFSGPGYKEFASRFIDSMFVKETPVSLREEIKSEAFKTPQHVAVSAMKSFGDPAIWQEDPVPVPTLAVYARSPHLPPDNEKYMRKLFPNMEYHEWEGVSHFLMMEQPEKFNRLLLDFIARNQ